MKQSEATVASHLIAHPDPESVDVPTKRRTEARKGNMCGNSIGIAPTVKEGYCRE